MIITKDTIPATEAELKLCLANPHWRVCSGKLYKIMVKSADDHEASIIPFVPNSSQIELLDNLWHRSLILKARQLGFCLDPTTRVLTADLRWVPIADLKTGDEVVAVDEHPPGGRCIGRKMRTATVQASQIVHRTAYRVKFDDGREVVCTDQHPWLTKTDATKQPKWRSLSGEGNKVVGQIKIGTCVRWVTKPWGESTFDDGWFGGMLDGEGSISKRNSSAGISVSQREGHVWDRMVSYCEERGYSHCIESDKPERLSKYGKVPVPKIAFGRMDEMFRVIGQTRPTRFIGNRFWEGRELPGKRNGGVGWATVKSIDLIGEQSMIDLQTSTGTYIAEGFVSHNTTLVSILWLDHALFNDNQRVGIIAQDREAAEVIFRDKVKLAYDKLPEQLKKAMPLARDSASELLFAHNNSSIRVATSMRSGTIHRLLVSEFGKICAKYPDKATEVVTGSLPAVPLDGIAIIESTAEGQEGEFYKMVQRAKAHKEQGKQLTARDYRFHFFPWHQDARYTLASGDVVITDKDREYFASVETDARVSLTEGQRRWYVATRDADFSGDPEKMWAEYPSTANEAFQISTDGCYYAVQLAQARKDGRITSVPYTVGVPVDTFWDIGLNDETTIWFHQKVGLRHCFIRYYENSGEAPAHYVKKMQDTGYVWGRHYLPHDGNSRRIQSDTTKSYADLLADLGVKNIEIVDRISAVTTGIQMVRNVFGNCWFDETLCDQGLKGLQNYRKEWNRRLGVWSDYPRHDSASNSADAFRQFAQGYTEIFAKGEKPTSWRDRMHNKSNRSGSAMAA